MPDLAKCLEELESDSWGEATYDSYLVTTVHRLRRKPLRDFTVEDLRLMLGQGVHTSYLLPLALGHLEADPFVSGDFYAGDLMASCLRLAPSELRSHQALLARLQAVAKAALQELESQAEAPPELRGDLEAFLAWAAV